MTFSSEMHKTVSTETELGNKSLFKIKPPNLFNIILTFIQAGGVHFTLLTPTITGWYQVFLIPENVKFTFFSHDSFLMIH